MKTYDYAFRFIKEDDGWVITCRDLPEAISQAEADENRVKVAEGCLQAALESRIRDNEPRTKQKIISQAALICSVQK